MKAKINTTNNYRNLNGKILEVKEIVGTRVSCKFTDEFGRDLTIDFGLSEVQLQPVKFNAEKFNYSNYCCVKLTTKWEFDLFRDWLYNRSPLRDLLPINPDDLTYFDTEPMAVIYTFPHGDNLLTLNCYGGVDIEKTYSFKSLIVEEREIEPTITYSICLTTNHPDLAKSESHDVDSSIYNLISNLIKQSRSVK